MRSISYSAPATTYAAPTMYAAPTTYVAPVTSSVSYAAPTIGYGDTRSTDDLLSELCGLLRELYDLRVTSGYPAPTTASAAPITYAAPVSHSYTKIEVDELLAQACPKVSQFYTKMEVDELLAQARSKVDEKENARPIAVGDKIPSVTIDHGFNPIGKVNMAERTKGKNVIILGLPGAFTPT